MGKTPEKPRLTSSNAVATTLRYRRKAPVASENSNSLNTPVAPAVASAVSAPASGAANAPPHKSSHKQRRPRSNQDGDAEPRASDDTRVDDNQLEHRSAEPATTVITGDAPAADSHRSDTTKDAHASARRKKHKPVASGAGDHPHDAPASGTKTKKTLRRDTVRAQQQQQLPPPADALPLPPTPLADAVSKSPRTSASPKPKRTHSKKRAKRVAVAAVESPDVALAGAADSTTSTPAAATVAAVTEPRRRAPAGAKRTEPPSLMQLLWQAKAPAAATLSDPPVRSSNQDDGDNDDDDDGEGEAAYAAEQRHARKRLSNSLAKALGSCLVESSSQETQSGSDDEAFAHFALLSRDESPALLDSCFPTPLALDSVAAAAAASSARSLRRAHVHDVTVTDFSFEPATLSVVKGDIVRWRVSDETLGMVEHALDATLRDATGIVLRKTSTPLLSPGSAFAWRLDVAGRLDVECSVYKAQCHVVINESVAAKRRAAQSARNATDAAVTATPPRRMVKTKTKTKSKAAAQAKRAAKLVQSAEAVTESGALEPSSDDAVTVFHPASDLARVPELDAGVCRAVLAQLDEVRAASFVVVGDIACPLATRGDASVAVATEDTGDEPERDGDDIVNNNAADDDDDAPPSEAVASDNVEDFQQRIIAMLQRSEVSQLQHRSSFALAGSGFDASAAYDFFKRRFAAVQSADASVAYARCPKRQATSRRSKQLVTNLLRALAK